MYDTRMVLLHELSHITGAELVDGPETGDLRQDKINKIVQQQCLTFLTMAKWR
jgi:hypothetical protein